MAMRWEKRKGTQLAPKCYNVETTPAGCESASLGEQQLLSSRGSMAACNARDHACTKAEQGKSDLVIKWVVA